MTRWTRHLHGLLMALLMVAALPAMAQSAVDLPACEASAPGRDATVSLGIVQPHASAELVNYAVRLTLADPGLNVCAESWDEVLPRWVPWAPAMERGLGWGLFALAFVVAVTLLWFTTPSIWWRRTTLLGMLGVVTLTWLVGVAAMVLFQASGAQRLFFDTVVSLRVPRQAEVTWLNLAGARDLEATLASLSLLRQATQKVAPDTTAEPAPEPRPAGAAPSGNYRVAHRLNLRSAAGTHSEWLATLPRGEVVRFDDAQLGDWWRVRRSNGTVGWCSSLWLRRPAENLPLAPSTPERAGAS